MRPRQCLPGCPNSDQSAHEEREVGTRGVDEVPLADVFPAPEGGPPRATAIEHMLEASLHELASLPHPPSTGVGGRHSLRGFERGTVLLAQSIPSACSLGIADRRVDAYPLEHADLNEVAAVLGNSCVGSHRFACASGSLRRNISAP
jgi:hypothetical protein